MILNLEVIIGFLGDLLASPPVQKSEFLKILNDCFEVGQFFHETFCRFFQIGQFYFENPGLCWTKTVGFLMTFEVF